MLNSNFKISFIASALFLSSNIAGIAGIPEPELLFVGSITSTSGTSPLSGGVEFSLWSNLGKLSRVAHVVNLNGSDYYVLRVPSETRFAGNLAFPSIPNSLPLTATPTTFTRSVTVNGVPATIVPPASTNFVFSKADRGKIERVDLLVDLPGTPDPDADGDGMSDWAELIAGTDPNNANSVFKASSEIEPSPTGGLTLKWSSVVGKSYSVFRSSEPSANYTALATNLVATSTQQQFTDSTASGPGPFFYRIKVNQ